MGLPLFLAMAIGLLQAAGDEKAKEDAIKTEKKTLQGTWRVASFTDNGKPLDFGKGATVIFGDNKLTNKQEGKAGSTETAYRIDPTKKPKTIDLYDDGAKQWVQGIYTIDGDELKICFDKGARKERPTDFTSKPGSGNALMILKREKP